MKNDHFDRPIPNGISYREAYPHMHIVNHPYNLNLQIQTIFVHHKFKRNIVKQTQCK